MRSKQLKRRVSSKPKISSPAATPEPSEYSLLVDAEDRLKRILEAMKPFV